MNASSLKPDIEFELFKLILLRESYLKRLAKKTESKKGTVDIGLIGLLDVLREVSVEVVDTIRMWERTQLDYPNVQPFKWNGVNYLQKMANDLEFLEQYHQISSWLGFSMSHNPFIVPPDVLTDETLHIKPGSFVVFGRKPDKYIDHTPVAVKNRPQKSPYTTPIINDPEVFAHLSVKKQLERKFKAATAAAVSKAKQNGERSGGSDLTADADPFESYLSFELVEKIRSCWRVLFTANFASFSARSNANSTFGTAVVVSDVLSLEDNDARQLQLAEEEGEEKVWGSSTRPDPFASILEGRSTDQPPLNSSTNYLLDGSTGSVVNRSGAQGEEEEDFRRSKSMFYRSLQESSGAHYHLMDARNQSLRMSQTSARSTAGDSSVAPAMSSSQVWTPHEIHLQRQVQRRGGELFVLTAAGTKGRMKAPWRRTRFERMETDIEQMGQQSAALARSLLGLAAKAQNMADREETAGSELDDSEALARAELLKGLEQQVAAMQELKRDVDLRQGFMQYQHQHFKMVAEGGALTDLDKQRRLHQLGDGQALEGDEQVAMSLEDRMAFRIQRRVRLAFGRALRKALLQKRNHAAMVIQGLWRRAQVHMMSLSRGKQLRLALMLQRLYRGGAVNETMRALRREAEERVATLNLQRVFRGYLGRQRLSLKREFVRSLEEAQRVVSLRVLSPGDLEELADAIELFVRDYTLTMPVAVLTVLRAVLYIFNGDAAECVNVSSGGYTEKKYIKASIATWHGVKLILRRKGRVLRRLRVLIKNSRLPNPSTLKFSADCATHLTALVEGVSEQDFEDLTAGRHCIVQLYHYCVHLKRAFDLQGLFPEYFDPGQPGWFRILLKLRGTFDRADLRRKMESKCKARLEEHKRLYAREGRSWKPVGDAVKRNAFLLEEAKVLRLKAKQKYVAYIAQLVAGEQKRVRVLQGIERSRALGVEVAQGDLREYLRHCFIADEKVLRDLHYTVDTKTISLLQTRADIIIAIETNERNEATRDFERHMKFKRMHDKCAELGAVLADLMVLLNRWTSLINSIGGFQYVKDLVGSRRELYEHLREQALRLMDQRRQAQRFLEDELTEQYDKMLQLSHAAGLKVINQFWDAPTVVEVSAEDEENRECCRRDADFELRQKRQTNFVTIPNAPFHPVLVLVDARAPRNIRHTIVNTLTQFDFELCSAHQSDPHLYNLFQATIDARRNIIFFANRGAHQIARLAFMTMFNSLLAGLIPRPHVVGVDFGRDLHIADWHSVFSADQRGMSQADVNRSVQCDLSLGKVRKIASKFKALLLTPSQNSGAGSNIPKWLRRVFLADFRSFMDCISTLKLSKTDVTTLSSSQYADLVLAAAISCVFEFWRAPLTEWRDEDVLEGCRAFRDKCRGLSYRGLCDLLALQSPLNTETIASRRLSQSTHLTRAWLHLQTLDFHKFPARTLLTQWLLLIRDLLDWLSTQGGQADSGYKNCDMEFVRDVCWRDDVLFCGEKDRPSLPGEQLVGDLLYACLRPSLIFESKDCPVKFYFDRANLESTELQSIGVVPSRQHVCVYQCDDETFVSVAVDSDKLVDAAGTGGRVRSWKYFARMKVREVISMLQPNNTEIFEGKVKKFDIRSKEDGGSGKHKWYELLASWACLDNIGEKFKITLLRARFLILSKIGQSNGYFIRLEIFEERFGEVRILVYGILESGGALSFCVDRAVTYDLLTHCDPHEERDKLEALDTQSIAYIFSDRLEVRPSRNWQHFLTHGELLPKSMDREVTVKLRKKRGPGRFVGRKVVKVSSVSLVVTIYEIDNETSAHELRVVLYETHQCQTVEYRISPMERLMLFSDDQPLLDQICGRIRHVYCDASEKSRRLMLMDESSFEPLIVPFEVDGDDEYDICSVISEDGDEDTFGGGGTEGGDEGVDSLQSAPEDSVSFGEDDDEDTEERRKRQRRRASQLKHNRSTDSASESIKYKARSNWRWAVYFHRSIVSEYKGNLIVSVGLSVALSGFTVIVFDQRTFREAYRLVSFDEACLLQDRSLASLQEELANLDESVAFDLLDDLLALVEATDSDEEGLAIVLSGAGGGDDQQEGVEDMIVARLKEHRSFVPDTMSRKRQGVPIQEVEIVVYGAKELARLGNFGSRNCIALVKWNMREIGRTSVARSTLSPSWEEGHTFRAMTVRDQHIKDCSIDVELWDTNGIGTLTEFLGCVRYAGMNLVKFLEGQSDAGGRHWHDLCKSKRLSETENRSVKGAVEVGGRKWELVVAAQQSAADLNARSADEASADGSVDKETRRLLIGVETNDVPAVFVRGKSRTSAKSNRDLSRATPQFTGVSFKTKMDEREAEEDALDAPQTFYLSVVCADRMPSCCEVVCIVKLNGLEVARMASTSNEANFMQAVAEFAPSPVLLHTPPGYPIGGCCLTVEVHRSDLKECLGSTELRGSALRSFVSRRATNSPTWCELLREGPQVGANEPCRVQLFASCEEILQQKFTLNVLGAQNIAKADTFGKSDPYVKVFFNDRLVGQTRFIKNTLSPDWGDAEVFSLVLPVGRSLDACRLEVEVYDHDAITADDFLGARVIQGDELVALLSAALAGSSARAMPKDAKRTSRGVAYLLQRSDKSSVEQSIAIKGDIELGGAVDETTEKAFQQHMTSVIEDGSRTTPEDASLSLLEFIQNEECLDLVLNVFAARGLAKADLFGKSDPFVIVSLNGRVVGRTRCLKNTLDPVWGDSEVFTLRVPRGQTLSACVVQLEAFDADNLTQGDFLGKVLLTGPQLVQMTDNAISAGVAISQHSLLPSASRTEKENELAKGDLELRIHLGRTSAACWTEALAAFERQPVAVVSIAAVEDLVLAAEGGLLGGGANPTAEVLVVWNGQHVACLSATWYHTTNSFTFPADFNSFTLCLPSSKLYSAIDCVLQLQLHSHEKLVAEVTVHRDKLPPVLRVNAPSSLFLRPTALTVTSISTKSRKLPVMRVSCLSFDTPAEIALVVEEEAPRAAYDSGAASMLGPIENGSYPLINTALRDEDTEWRYHFPEWIRPEAVVTDEEDDDEHNVEEEVSVQKEPASRSDDEEEQENVNVLPTSHSRSAKDVRAQLTGSPSKATSAVDVLNTETVAEAVATPAPNLVETALAMAAATAMASKPKTQKMQLELAALNFTVTVREILDDNRTCWRGRVMPKNFLAADDTAKKAIMMSRSSRLIRMRNLNEMQVLAEVHYLADTGDEDADTGDLLPICVKEIVTNGPGLTRRLYRVEVSANNGILMGSADIMDDETDIRRVLGAQHDPEMLRGPKKLWRLGSIFEHVVRERLVLDMMPTHRKHGATKDGRRDGVSAVGLHHPPQEHPTHAVDDMDVTGSLITLIRDPLPAELGVKPHTVPEEEDDEDAASATSPLPSGFVAEEEEDVVAQPHAASVEGSVLADGESMVATNRSVQSEDANAKLHWLRIHTRTHRLTGKTFLTLVLLQSTSRTFGEETDYYFKTYPATHILGETTILFRLKDSWTKLVHDLRIPGSEILAWLPDGFLLDLKTKFRRDKFGAYLVQYLSLRFDEDGGFAIYLIKEDHDDAQPEPEEEDEGEENANELGGDRAASGDLGDLRGSNSRRGSRIQQLRRSSVNISGSNLGGTGQLLRGVSGISVEGESSEGGATPRHRRGSSVMLHRSIVSNSNSNMSAGMDGGNRARGISEISADLSADLSGGGPHHPVGGRRRQSFSEFLGVSEGRDSH